MLEGTREDTLLDIVIFIFYSYYYYIHNIYMIVFSSFDGVVVCSE